LQEELQLRDWLLQDPSIVVVDEAHNIKNPKSRINKAMCMIKTRCRLALTGYPLQNNMDEYYCMINWVSTRSTSWGLQGLCEIECCSLLFWSVTLLALCAMPLNKGGLLTGLHAACICWTTQLVLLEITAALLRLRLCICCPCCCAGAGGVHVV
jgi:hypothetical protein